MNLFFMLLGIPISYWLARRLSRQSPDIRIRVLFWLGICLCCAELYKQYFLYFTVFGRHYEWWYFPFQLCSIPMYLCPLLPRLQKKPKAFRAAITFLGTYTLLGALMVFIDPSGMYYPYLRLTMHSYLWHLTLIFIGFTARRLEEAAGNLSKRSFVDATLLFLGLCVIAEVINLAPFTGEYVDMFYISPLHPSAQIVFSDIASKFGTAAGIICYIASIILGAALLQFTSYKHQKSRLS